MGFYSHENNYRLADTGQNCNISESLMIPSASWLQTAVHDWVKSSLAESTYSFTSAAVMSLFLFHTPSCLYGHIEHKPGFKLNLSPCTYTLNKNAWNILVCIQGTLIFNSLKNFFPYAGLLEEQCFIFFVGFTLKQFSLWNGFHK